MRAAQLNIRAGPEYQILRCHSQQSQQLEWAHRKALFYSEQTSWCHKDEFENPFPMIKEKAYKAYARPILECTSAIWDLYHPRPQLEQTPFNL